MAMKQLFAAAALLVSTALPHVARAAELTTADAQAWLDGLMPTALHQAQVPGAVVVIVKDGQPLLQKGYGLADVATQTPVDPQATLFRPGSISKLFTWTAVMQLVERHQLDLDADINRYLDFTVPAYKGQALTLRHVLTHTTGFEETNRDLVRFNGVEADKGTWLKRHLPAQLFDPGSAPGYSNYATTLAGYIVERVSGLPFNDVIEQRILTPLGMRHSSFRQPLPPELAAGMATGYLSREEAGHGFETVQVGPAGSLSSTGADMGRFMIAYLQAGRLGEAQILQPETVRAMHGTETRALPDLNGMALGFYRQDVNGHRVVAHGGNTIYFHSDLVLFVDDHVGLFLSVNAAGKDELGSHLRERLFHAFASRYFPARTVASTRSSTALEHAKLMAGNYAMTRGASSNFMALLPVLSPFTLVARDDGMLQLRLGEASHLFTETTQPFLWREVGSENRLQAIVKDGKVQRWSLEPYAFAFVFEPVQGWAAAPLALAAVVGALGVVLLTALTWPIAAFARRGRGVRPSPSASLHAVRSTSVLVLAALGLWAWVLHWLGTGFTDIPATLLATQSLSLLAFTGGLAAALWRVKVVFQSGHGRGARALAALWLAAFGLLLAFAFSHHLIDFNPNY